MAEAICETHLVDEGKVQTARKAMPGDEQLTDLAEVYKVLGHPGRLKIVHALFEDELCVCDLSALLGTTISAASHQLRVLRNHRLVRNRREGKLVYYRLDDDHVKQLFEAGLEHILEPNKHALDHGAAG